MTQDIIYVLSCLFATAFFALLLNQPVRTVIFSALLASAGYIVYLALDKTAVGYFCAALLIGIVGEVLARFNKTPATVFIISSVVPIVPGIGLYRTALYLTNSDWDAAIETGTETVLGICAIALAITVSTIIFSSFARRAPHKERNHNEHFNVK